MNTPLFVCFLYFTAIFLPSFFVSFFKSLSYASFSHFLFFQLFSFIPPCLLLYFPLLFRASQQRSYQIPTRNARRRKPITSCYSKKPHLSDALVPTPSWRICPLNPPAYTSPNNDNNPPKQEVNSHCDSCVAFPGFPLVSIADLFLLSSYYFLNVYFLS